MPYEIATRLDSTGHLVFYGNVRKFIACHEQEAIIHGPAETGKTLGALAKLHLCACKYSGARIAIVRKTQTSAYNTVLRTFEDRILALADGWGEPYGGVKPQWYQYANGSRIVIGGMDKASRVLSAEFDIVYVNQAEELELDDWETLTTRATGRAGNMPYAQTIGDMNPAWPQHWSYHRKSLRLFYSTHQDNPALYDQETGELTEQGQRTMAVLEALTGVRRERLLYGKPAQAEGAIYDEWNDAIHLLYEDQVPDIHSCIAGVDWGYTNPGVIGVWGLDGDGRMYLVAQVYRTGCTIDWWTEQARQLQEEFSITAFVCDPSEPAYIESFLRAGLHAVAAPNAVLPGINAVKERLAIAGDGKARLFVVRDSLRNPDPDLQDAQQPYSVEHEIPGYVWADNKAKEQPVKQGDHGMDMMRYVAFYLQEPRAARYAPSIYGPLVETPPKPTAWRFASEHADTEAHRKWAKKNFCQQCYDEHMSDRA